ncbi:ubiquinone biosynthesis accessory factor UbiJ [Pseudoalteromonas peptidolytica]|uniref:ubiquinone biosynthesis accessory factor UbiJ n=1 Tax=Pseudoalteromonas peptidolytica TaxID=61150 RepID=UPI00298DA76A|nr:SCP2 sterol-binding domain-containing protein [Pseudoalteromonas peptidolytica]MDW7551184.1 SCP2 sterol-binding domain-containing protein [Pseudoalteromonas peptidolytica]
MLASLLGAVIEAALNKALTLSSELQGALSKGRHKILSVEVRDLHLHLAITNTGEHIHVLCPFDGNADCTISADCATLLELTDPSKLTALIRQDKLDLDGDLALAQLYSNALAALDIDWAEHLAQYLGDAPAQVIVDSINTIRKRAQQDAQVAKVTLSELLQDELKVSPHPLEFEQFKQQVRSVNSQLESVAQRINTLLQNSKGN